MKLAIATVCLSGGLVEKLEAIAAAGFKGVEIFENDLLSFNGTPADVRRMVADLGMEIITFQPFRDFEGMPGDKRARAFARAERKFDLMQELGTDLLVSPAVEVPVLDGDVVTATLTLAGPSGATAAAVVRRLAGGGPPTVRRSGRGKRRGRTPLTRDGRPVGE